MKYPPKDPTREEILQIKKHYSHPNWVGREADVIVRICQKLLAYMDTEIDWGKPDCLSE